MQTVLIALQSYLGIFVVVAAGNTGKPIEYKALANFSDCIAVAAVNDQGKKITVSSTGTNVFCAAPGEDINDFNGGTSWVVPHVSASLVFLSILHF
ncbi:MAG: S8 family serine peptidase [Clostridiales bacterium]|nr:S8 family serine peptidase [Clostridiales bacterium]